MLRNRKWLMPLLLAGGLIGAAGYFWTIYAGAPIETIGARPLSRTSSPVTPTDGKYVSVFVIGDTGAETTQRKRVIEQMARKAGNTHPQLVMLLGDNFYDDGVASITDPLWERDFERPFRKPELAVPFYAALGNHDHRGSIQAQIEYAGVNRRWHMPNAYYSFERPIANDETAEFFVLDTDPMEVDPESQAMQVQWLREKLSASHARWKIVAAHHPILSGGHHGPSTHVASLLCPLFEEFQVDLYMSGHDHDLQLIDSKHGWLQLVCGAGSSLRSVQWTDTTLFAEASGGFAWLLLTPDELSIEFITIAGHRYTHRTAKRSPATARREPVAGQHARRRKHVQGGHHPQTASFQATISAAADPSIRMMR